MIKLCDWSCCRVAYTRYILILGDNGTIDGQGELWWQKFKKGELKYTRPYLIEIMYSEKIQISNITLINSPSWNVHPVYSRFLSPSLPFFLLSFVSKRSKKHQICCGWMHETNCVTHKVWSFWILRFVVIKCSNVLVQGITILAPVTSPNTDGINPGKHNAFHIH